MDGAIRDLCSAVENHKIVAVLVVGSNAAARGVAMAAGATGLPVLWARNDTQAPFYQQVGLFSISITSLTNEYWGEITLRKKLACKLSCI